MCACVCVTTLPIITIKAAAMSVAVPGACAYTMGESRGHNRVNDDSDDSRRRHLITTRFIVRFYTLPGVRALRYGNKWRAVVFSAVWPPTEVHAHDPVGSPRGCAADDDGEHYGNETFFLRPAPLPTYAYIVDRIVSAQGPLCVPKQQQRLWRSTCDRKKNYRYREKKRQNRWLAALKGL